METKSELIPLEKYIMGNVEFPDTQSEITYNMIATLTNRIAYLEREVAGIRGTLEQMEGKNCDCSVNDAQKRDS